MAIYRCTPCSPNIVLKVSEQLQQWPIIEDDLYVKLKAGNIICSFKFNMSIVMTLSWSEDGHLNWRWFGIVCKLKLKVGEYNLLIQHVMKCILKTVNIEVGHRSSNKLHSSLHTHKDRKHKNTQPGVYKIPCKCGKVYIGETGRSFNTRIKEHKVCQRLGDGDKSAIVKHAQQQQHKINWEDGSLITSIPHWHTRRVREAIEILQHNTVPQGSRLHINNIWHPLLQKTHHQALLHPGPQPTQKSSTLQLSSLSPEDGQHRLTEISRHLLGATASFTSSCHDMLLMTLFSINCHDHDMFWRSQRQTTLWF